MTSDGQALALGGEPGDKQIQELFIETANRLKTIMREFTNQVLTLNEPMTGDGPHTDDEGMNQMLRRKNLVQWQKNHGNSASQTMTEMSNQVWKLIDQVPDSAGTHTPGVVETVGFLMSQLKTTFDRQMQVVVDDGMIHRSGRWEQPGKSYSVVEQAVDKAIADLPRALFPDNEWD
jgi:hypothetical protein